MIVRNFFIFFILFFSAVLFFLPKISSAGSLTIVPVKFELTGNPGDVISEIFRVRNNDPYTVDIFLSKEDFVPSDDTVQFVGRAEGVATSLFDWIDIQSPSIITLRSGEMRAIPIVITIPKTTPPGARYAILFAKSLPKEEGIIAASLRLGAKIELLIPGDVDRSGELGGFSISKIIKGKRIEGRFYESGPFTFSSNFRNTGSVHYSPAGTISIYNILGQKIKDVSVTTKTVLPGGYQNIETQWDAGYVFGYLKAVINIADGNGKNSTKTMGFLVIPWKHIIVITALAAILAGLIFVISKRFKITIIASSNQ